MNLSNPTTHYAYPADQSLLEQRLHWESNPSLSPASRLRVQCLSQEGIGAVVAILQKLILKLHPCYAWMNPSLQGVETSSGQCIIENFALEIRQKS